MDKRYFERNASYSFIVDVMKIEEAIKQTKPWQSVHQKAMVNVLLTYSWLSEKLREILKPFDITIQQYNMLRILRGAEGPLSTSKIRSRMIDKMSDTSRMVNRLQKKKLVDRNVCCGDRRLVDIEISKEGLSLLNQIDTRIHPFHECCSSLSQEEASQLSDLLDKLRSKSVFFNSINNNSCLIFMT